MPAQIAYLLLQELPQAFKDSRKRLERLIQQETSMPLHQRKFFAGLPGDYKLIDERGIEVWASEWCHKSYIQTCPRGLHKR